LASTLLKTTPRAMTHGNLGHFVWKDHISGVNTDIFDILTKICYTMNSNLKIK